MSDGAKIQEQNPINAENPGNETATKSVKPTAKKRASRTLNALCLL
jgi:hypothetical protein